MMGAKAVLFLVVSLVLASASAWGQNIRTKSGAPAAKVSGPDEQETRNYFTDLPVVTQDGRVVRFYTDVLKDNVVLINFIYTNCQGTCPLLTYKLTQVRDQLAELFGRAIYFVSITTDAERDTPQALTKFAEQHSANGSGWLFLTGEKQNVDTIIKKFGQYSPQVGMHSTLLLAANVKSRHWMKIDSNAPVPAIVRKLRDLAGES